MNKILFEEIVKDIQSLGTNMTSLIVTQNDIQYKYLFEDEHPLNIHSISKTITCLALGIAISKGYFKDGVETYIMPYFKDTELINKNNLKYLEKIQIKHLITLTAGYDKQIEKYNYDNTYLEYALNYPIIHKPGVFFSYRNELSYLLSIMIEKETAMKLSDFVKNELMDKLDINLFSWMESSEHHSMGCTGIYITPSDLHKIGMLFLNKGIYNDIQIISEKWLKEMATLKVMIPDEAAAPAILSAYGYGYNLFLCKTGIYYHYGTNGQYMIVAPNQDMVITTTANQKEMKPITECVKKLLR